MMNEKEIMKSSGGFIKNFNPKTHIGVTREDCDYILWYYKEHCFDDITKGTLKMLVIKNELPYLLSADGAVRGRVKYAKDNALYAYDGAYWVLNQEAIDSLPEK